MIQTRCIRAAGTLDGIIQPYHPVFLPQLTEMANRQIAAFPPYWQFTPAQAEKILFTPAPLTANHYEDFLPSDFEIETLCLAEGQELLTAAQLFIPRKPRLPGPAAISPFGLIHWIAASEDAPPECSAILLDTLAEKARAAGCQKLVFARNGMGAGWPGVGEAWSSITTALHERLFRQTARSIILSGSTEVAEFGSIDRLGAFGVARMPDEACGEWRIRAFAKDFPAGECEAWAIPERFAALPGSRRWVTVEWLSIDPRYRQRGLGRWIFAELLRWQHEMYRDYAVFWAADDNAAMLTLAHSLGFKDGPACLEFELEL
jgi:GNAT superfamily N-acetyltransferase